MNRDHNQQYQTPPNQTRDGIQLNVDSLICALRIEDFEHRIKRPRAVLAEGESEANDEQYPEVLKMWMKRTVFENVSQISDMINRRPQCKFLHFTICNHNRCHEVFKSRTWKNMFLQHSNRYWCDFAFTYSNIQAIINETNASRRIRTHSRTT